LIRTEHTDQTRQLFPIPWVVWIAHAIFMQLPVPFIGSFSLARYLPMIEGFSRPELTSRQRLGRPHLDTNWEINTHHSIQKMAQMWNQKLKSV